MKRPSSRRDIALLISGVSIAALLISPAGAHVGGTVKHLWGHLKPKVTKLVYTKKQSNDRFAPRAAGAWRDVGAAGQPPFGHPGFSEFCQWQNYDESGDHTTVAFRRDPWGSVHLKGMAKMTPGTSVDECILGMWIFTLPEGYRPSARTVFTTLSNGAVGRINVDPDGRVQIDTPTTIGNAKAWISLDGIDFKAAPSG